MDSPRLVVLVHGAWHGAWCFSALQAELDRRGIPSLAVDLPGHGASAQPLGDFYGDARGVVAVLAALRERGNDHVVLVGHSYGGAVITEVASIDLAIGHLVYLAAFVPPVGQSVMSQLMGLPRHDTTLGAAMIALDEANTVVDPTRAKQAFYGNCADSIVAASVVRLSPQPTVTMTQAVTGSPLGTIASTYVLCRQDQAVHPEHQKAIAELCDSVVILDTDHSPFASMVVETADILERIART